jgi:hypothetical protein
MAKTKQGSGAESSCACPCTRRYIVASARRHGYRGERLHEVVLQVEATLRSQEHVDPGGSSRIEEGLARKRGFEAGRKGGAAADPRWRLERFLVDCFLAGRDYRFLKDALGSNVERAERRPAGATWVDLDDDLLTDLSPAADEEVAHDESLNELREKLVAAIRTLAPEDRLAFELWYGSLASDGYMTTAATTFGENKQKFHRRVQALKDRLRPFLTEFRERS